MSIIYTYKSVTVSGRQIEGQFTADNKSQVIDFLKSKNQYPVSVKEQKIEASSNKSIFKKKVKTKDLVIFLKQFYTMINAGLYLTKCLEVLITQTENVTLKNAVIDLHKSTQKGDVLSKAMRTHTKVFPEILINMVESSELTGNLGDVLEKMSVHFEKENRINSKIKGALMYPSILAIVAVLAVVFLLTFVMPTFIEMFITSGVELPGLTQVLLNISEAIRSYWYIFVGIVVAIVFGIKRVLGTLDGRRFFDRLKFKIPVVGKAVTKIITSRFTRTLSTLLSSGIPILEAVKAAGQVTNNQIVIDELRKGIKDIREGTGLSLVFKSMNIFPPMMVSMLAIGEESGSLSEMLDKTANFYDEELDSAIQKLLSLIEPIMIVLMAVIIGFIVIAMMLPMFDMMKAV